MPKAALYNPEGIKVGDVDLNDDVFGVPLRKVSSIRLLCVTWLTRGLELLPPNTWPGPGWRP